MEHIKFYWFENTTTALAYVYEIVKTGVEVRARPFTNGVSVEVIMGPEFVFGMKEPEFVFPEAFGLKAKEL